MGADKWSIEIGGATFSERVIAAAAASFDRVFVVTKAGRGSFSVPVIHERNGDVAAPIIGLDCALDHAAGEPCWVLGVDYPLMTAAALTYLRGRFEASGAEIAVPEIGSKLHMLCAGYRATTSATVKARIAEGRLALKGLVDAHSALIVSEREVVEHCGRAAMTNVNTPAELEEARRLDAEAKGR
jgi:molybdopterin-guanine dinucleotide biosynthesis protein A